MEKLKDWFYNYSDIFVGILITAFAGVIIFGSVNQIMSFSDSFGTFGEGTKKDNEPVIYGASSAGGVASSGSALSGGGVSGEEDGQQTPASITSAANTPPASSGGTIRARVTVVIPNGSTASQIAQLLKDNGLITDTNDFLSVLAAGKLDSKLRSGTFTVPEGSTVTEVINILTGR